MVVRECEGVCEVVVHELHNVAPPRWVTSGTDDVAPPRWLTSGIDDCVYGRFRSYRRLRGTLHILNNLILVSLNI